MRTVRRLAALLVTMMTVGLFGALPASAEVVCYDYDRRGLCILEVDTSSTPGGGGGKGDADGTVTVKGQVCGWGWGVDLLDPQPDADDPRWEGHYPDGHIYRCMVTEKYVLYFWSPDRLGGPTPQELAQRAVDEMEIVAPEIGLTGYGKPESLQLLGLPTWMWAADPGVSTTGPVTRSASAGAVTVEATGRLTATVWQMGDGSVVTCAGPNAAGTPYDGSYGGGPSPTCGYQYGWTSAREPGGAFTVTVTANWEITWRGGGQSGVITMPLVRSTQLRVGEVQVITDRRGDRG